ncbi:MAG TPA: LysR family transcriptional regulator [Thioalkalivibrio sp.]|nr:LysR family transcriptional regulator [Thioalkalivibrio sp.]
MTTPRITLDQWQALQALADHGSFSAAAQDLELSDSAVRFALHKLEDKLQLKLLEQGEDGRVRITDAGHVLLDRARQLMAEARKLEGLARDLREHDDTCINLVVDTGFPTNLLLEALRRFEEAGTPARINLREVAPLGVQRALRAGEADLALGSEIPEGFKGQPITTIEYVAVAQPHHPLHDIKRKLLPKDLTRHLQIIVQGASGQFQSSGAWVRSERQWTVATLHTALTLVKAGLGFSWLPSHLVKHAIEHGEIKPLKFQAGGSYHVSMFLVVRDAMECGPAAAKLASILQQINADPKQSARA